MAKLKVQGNASGTGVVTLTAPNTNTDRTITLPDDTQTLIGTNASGKVGIGTTTPSTGLSVVTGSANGIELGQDSDLSTDSGRLFFSTSAGSNSIVSHSGALGFNTGATAGSSSGTERMRIDSAGAVTMPSQPAFHAWRQATPQTLSAVTDTIVFNAERFDQNSDFDTTTGKFTAPVTGRYAFQWMLRIDSLEMNSEHYSMDLWTSNQYYVYQNIIDSRCFDANSEWWSFNGSLLVDMDAGDVAYIQSYINTNAGGYRVAIDHSSFSGYLVC